MAKGQIFAAGTHAMGECARSGRKMRLRDMVADGRFPWLMVDPQWKEDPHPQEKLKPPVDPVALRRPAPQLLPSPSTPVIVAAGGNHYTDDFNRADGALASPWTSFGSFTQSRTVSNQMGASFGPSGAVLEMPYSSSSADMTVTFTYSNASLDGREQWIVFLRASEIYPAGSIVEEGYMLTITKSLAGAWTAYLYFLVNHSPVGAQIVTPIGIIDVGDVIELAVRDWTITLKVNGEQRMSLVDEAHLVTEPALHLPMAIWNLYNDGNPAPILDNLTVTDGPTLRWSESLAPASQIESYRIYRSVDAEAFALYDEVELERSELGEILTPLEYMDLETDFDAHSYRYYVVAVPVQGPPSAQSNTVTLP